MIWTGIMEREILCKGKVSLGFGHGSRIRRWMDDADGN